MANNPPPIPTKVITVYREFKGRRDGLLKALTTDFAEVYELCDPEKENLNLCLRGLPNGKWQVFDTVEVDPLQVPEPTVGINFRKGMQAKDWLSLVAIHSDSWLISVAFYFGAVHRLDKNERNILFQMISDLPTLFEEVASNAKPEDQSATLSKSSEKTQSHKSKAIAEPVKDDESGEEEDDEDKTICGACEDISVNDEFWICCDTCDKWFHGKCVKITPARAEHIKHYKCPGCSERKGRARAST